MDPLIEKIKELTYEGFRVEFVETDHKNKLCFMVRKTVGEDRVSTPQLIINTEMHDKTPTNIKELLIFILDEKKEEIGEIVEGGGE